MFNNKRIEELEWQVKHLTTCLNEQRDRYWQLLEKIEVLAKHHNLKFEQKPAVLVLTKEK